MSCIETSEGRTSIAFHFPFSSVCELDVLKSLNPTKQKSKYIIVLRGRLTNQYEFSPPKKSKNHLKSNLGVFHMLPCVSSSPKWNVCHIDGPQVRDISVIITQAAPPLVAHQPVNIMTGSYCNSTDLQFFSCVGMWESSWSGRFPGVAPSLSGIQ